MCHQDGRSVTLTHMQVCQFYYPVPRKYAGSVASDTTAMEIGGRSLQMKNNSVGIYSEGTSETSGPNCCRSEWSKLQTASLKFHGTLCLAWHSVAVLRLRVPFSWGFSVLASKFRNNVRTRQLLPDPLKLFCYSTLLQ